MLNDLQVQEGSASPLGYSRKENVSNFALYSANANQVILGLRHQGAIREIPLVQQGTIWHVGVAGLLEGVEYAYRVYGTDDPVRGDRFAPNLWLQDPWTQFPSFQSLPWGHRREDPWSLCKETKPFDWQGVQKPNIPFSELVIYEAHVRGFTRDPSSKVKAPGTFLGLLEKIPYLKKLGINAIELMPIFSFDEMRAKNKNPETGASLPNYWGYNPLSYFAPMGGYGSANPIEEFQTLVRELHRNGIEIFLDVVYNHTGEGKNEEDPFSFRAIDNCSYYMIDESGRYRDYTGCGNTFNSNHPAVLHLILSSLRYWAETMQVDGFRVDLAAVHTRGIDGKVIQHPPLLQAMNEDEILQQSKLFAEAWDATGLYLVGEFPRFGPWSVWNGKYRDTVRNFIKGTDGFAGAFADALSGSASLYNAYTPLRSLNFITAHDGFTLRDLVSYNEKQNLANGEEGRDGSNQNASWNGGAEGATDDPHIIAFREKQQRNFFLSLFLAQGIPMLLMGDEYGHTRRGNNNPYVQDNDLNWFLWNLAAEEKERLDFVSALIALRKKCPLLRRSRFLTPSEISWHGQNSEAPNWDPPSRFIAYMLHGSPPLFVAFNASAMEAQITLPPGSWNLLVATERPWREQNLLAERAEPLASTYSLEPYSALLAQGLG